MKLKITFNSPVILGFTAISFVTLLVNYLTGGISNQLLFMTYHSSPRSILTYIRFFTHVLGHAGWAHFIGNMSYILLLGPLLEEKYGPVRMVQVIAITALVTGLVNYVFFPRVALCGASGVCFAFILLSSFTSFREKEIPMTFILVAIIFLGQQVYEGLLADDNISNMAHIIGGLVGAGFGFWYSRRKAARK